MTMQRRERRRRSGMTLVEVLLAMMILGGGLLAMASVQLQSIKGGQRGRHLSTAANLATSQLEQLQRTRWTAIPDTGWTAPTSATGVVQRADADQAYALSWRVTTQIPDQTKAIDVRATWTDATGLNRTVTVSSIRHNHEAL